MDKVSDPLVSVVIPCFNHERYVTQAIESVEGQTYKNIQLIVINDGSIDNSEKVISELQKKYKFIFITQDNKGLCYTLNKAILEYAIGKYVACLASDDYWDKTKIEKQVDFLEAHSEYGVVYTKVYEVTKNQCVKSDFEGKEGFLFNDILLGHYNIPASTVMVRRSVYDEIWLFNTDLYYEDLDMWLRIAEKYLIGFIDEFLGYYRVHDTSMRSNRAKMRASELQVINNWKNKEQYNQAMANMYVKWFYYLSLNAKKEAVRYLFLGVKMNKQFTPKEYIFILRGAIKLFLPNFIIRLICKLKKH